MEIAAATASRAIRHHASTGPGGVRISPLAVFKGQDRRGTYGPGKYHANGKMDDEMVLHELAEIKEALELEKLATAVSYKTFTSTRGNKHRLAILIVSWLF
jgi:hypothetical protein